MSPAPGELTVAINDRTVGIDMAGGSSFVIPHGPLSLLDGPLERADPPRPEHLTNALAAVHDHLDDILIDTPAVADCTLVVATGGHALALARVEIGNETIPSNYRLHRAAADDLFRTLVAEPVAERLFNPCLTNEHVETIVGTCCVILAIMRRLELNDIEVSSADQGVD